MDSMIIHQPWGGLGDNLLWSTLPEMCHLNGIECYISDRNCVRNQGIYDLVWGSNPYIKGPSIYQPNAGLSRWPDDAGTRFVTDSCIKKSEYFHGFEPINKYPKIYYQYKETPEVNGKTILDLSAHNNSYNTSNLWNFIKNNCVLNNLVQIKHKNNFNNNYLIKDIETIDMENIFYYCDIINSCKEFICLYSGSSVLASAINKRNTKVFIRHGDKIENYKNGNNLFVFDNLDYIDTDAYNI
jgi:hypothetical protein